VLGVGPEAKRFHREYEAYGEKWRLEFVDPSGKFEGQQVDGFGSPVVMSNAEEMLAGIDESYAAVILATNTREFSDPLFNHLISLHCSRTPVLTIEAFREQQWYRVSARAVKPESLFQSEFRPARGSAYSHLKRIGDVLLSALALILLCPVLLLAALFIKLESRGSVIFKQTRVGRNGRPFQMYKLRSMRENAGDMYTRPGDNRITRLGRLLRLTHLDELPQLWNVLRGEMSLIGPRAEWVKCVEIYEKEIPHYHLRHLVTPGITGWAQVKFKYGESKNDAIEKFEFDLYYIQNFSLQLDLCIVLKTLHTMICGNGQ
jgi:lipopolysaccharide/colanic/teichoic acid biosynthesis glycosyltransferase